MVRFSMLPPLLPEDTLWLWTCGERSERKEKAKVFLQQQQQQRRRVHQVEDRKLRGGGGGATWGLWVVVNIDYRLKAIRIMEEGGIKISRLCQDKLRLGVRFTENRTSANPLQVDWSEEGETSHKSRSLILFRGRCSHQRSTSWAKRKSFAGWTLKSNYK